MLLDIVKLAVPRESTYVSNSYDSTLSYLYPNSPIASDAVGVSKIADGTLHIYLQ